MALEETLEELSESTYDMEDVHGGESESTGVEALGELLGVTPEKVRSLIQDPDRFDKLNNLNRKAQEELDAYSAAMRELFQDGGRGGSASPG